MWCKFIKSLKDARPRQVRRRKEQKRTIMPIFLCFIQRANRNKVSVARPDLKQPEGNIKKPSEKEEKPVEIDDPQPSENKDHGKHFPSNSRLFYPNSSILST